MIPSYQPQPISTYQLCREETQQPVTVRNEECTWKQGGQDNVKRNAGNRRDDNPLLNRNTPLLNLNT